jgi:hypothetical protein
VDTGLEILQKTRHATIFDCILYTSFAFIFLSMPKNLFNSIFSLISETKFEISLSNRSDKIKTFIDNKKLLLSYIFNLPAIFLALGEATISSILSTIAHFGCLISGIKGDNISIALLWLCNLILGVQIT